MYFKVEKGRTSSRHIELEGIMSQISYPHIIRVTNGSLKLNQALYILTS